jgi:CheY-like chemotaxis protein
MSIEQQNKAFLADLNHKLRTPLNAILGWIYVLRHGSPDPDLLHEGLDAIERNVRSQAQILDDVIAKPDGSDSKTSTEKERATQGQTAFEKVEGAASLAGNLERKLEGISVVAVDDDPEARKILKELLTHCRAIATVVANAGEALLAVERLHPDVLLCDLEMPGTDGYDLLRRLRSLGPERGGDTPAAALTAHAGPEDRTRVLETGFQLHVPKPVNPAELAAAIECLARSASQK